MGWVVVTPVSGHLAWRRQLPAWRGPKTLVAWKVARMNGQHARRVRVLACVLAAVAVGCTWAGAVAPAWPAAEGMTGGVRPPGALDAFAAGAARPAGSWGRAIEVPGLGALNKGGFAEVSSLSCASPRNCAAAGDYSDRRGHLQAFVAVERRGRWGQAIEVPGLGALNTGGDVENFSVSCGSAGKCSAAGDYEDGHGHVEGFVVSETSGRWAKAIEVPGLAALNTGGFAWVLSVSCGSAGNCAAGGFYEDRHEDDHGFVVIQRNGRWGTAFEVPGLAALNTGGSAWVSSVSCGSAGNCAAGGYYTDRHGHEQGFVAVERHGRWGKAIEVPGLAALNAGGGAGVDSVSCSSAGGCAAAGTYAAGSGQEYEAFVVGERNGVWGTAIQVPGLAALNKGGEVQRISVSCGSAGNCAAAGTYSARRYIDLEAFVVSETSGRWGQAIEVPGLGTLNKGGDVENVSVSCGSARTCAAGGDYSDGNVADQGFVVSETNRRWGQAIEVPGLGTLNKGGGVEEVSVSCGSARTCSAAGDYADRRGNTQGFVTSQT